MKIGILTYHACYNYGANLQAFALQQTLLSWGYDCEIIDYRNKDLQSVNAVLNFNIKYKTDIAFLVFNFIHYFRMRKRKQLFEDFIKDKLKCSRLCENSEDVFELSKKYDLIICGSDQIWNMNPKIKYNGYTYFLDFEKTTRRISYAASFGTNICFDNENVKNKVISLLKKFDTILVREEAAVEFLAKEGLEAKQVLDPTLLLDMNYYQKLVKKSDVRKPYIISLNWNGRPFVSNLAKQISKKLDIALVNPTPHPRNLFDGIRIKYETGPSEFLGLVSDAHLIVTSSFHAVVFSILFHRPFIAVLNATEKSFTKTDNRLVELLKNLGLEHCLVRSDANVDLDAVLQTDFSVVDSKLIQLRKSSLDALRKGIDDA